MAAKEPRRKQNRSVFDVKYRPNYVGIDVESFGGGQLNMTPEVSTVLKAALRLTPEQRRELIAELSRSSHRSLRPKTGDVTRYFGTIDSGDPSSGDNEKIDADLAAAYADDHEDDD